MRHGIFFVSHKGFQGMIDSWHVGGPGKLQQPTGKIQIRSSRGVQRETLRATQAKVT